MFDFTHKVVIYFFGFQKIFMNLAWSRQVTPDGKEYFFNSETNESVWERPNDFIPPPPPRNKLEKILEAKALNNEWIICLTSRDHEFFYNTTSGETSWDIPEDIVDLVGGLLQDAMGEEMDYESEENVDEVEVVFGDNDLDRDSIRNQNESLGEENDPMEIYKDEEVLEKEYILGQDSIESFIDGDESTKNITNKQKHKNTLAGKKSQANLIQDFNQMLHHKKISPFSPWELVLRKLKSETSFRALRDLKLCKSLFEKYCAEFTQEETHKDPQEAFMELLSSVKTRLRFEDFERKYKKDPRFANFLSSEKRSLFENYIKEITLEEQKRTTLVFWNLLKDGDFITKESSWLQVFIS
jgi:hypothetical protein